MEVEREGKKEMAREDEKGKAMKSRREKEK